MPSKQVQARLDAQEKLAADILEMRGVSHAGFIGEQKVMLALEVVLEESPPFVALVFEHRCRKLALEAVAQMQNSAIIHPPTDKEMANIKFLDNAHTVAWGKAEELIEAMLALRGGANVDG
ncbi:MAG: hypothetical protein M0R37_10495 [Bacteroidales bacterium]|jgi:hypothetical protein|nr:hypothetical protein [Bacteroidales bacterium]